MMRIIKHRKVRSLIIHTKEIQVIKTLIQSYINNLSKAMYGNTVSQD